MGQVAKTNKLWPPWLDVLTKMVSWQEETWSPRRALGISPFVCAYINASFVKTFGFDEISVVLIKYRPHNIYSLLFGLAVSYYISFEMQIIIHNCWLFSFISHVYHGGKWKICEELYVPRTVSNRLRNFDNTLKGSNIMETKSCHLPYRFSSQDVFERFLLSNSLRTRGHNVQPSKVQPSSKISR